MGAEPYGILDQVRPGPWDEFDAGVYDTLLALMQQAQEVCAARMERASGPFGGGEPERDRWLGVSRRISGWRTVLTPDNREAMGAVRAYCAQIVDDHAAALPVLRALDDGSAEALTPSAEAVRLDGAWWAAEEDRYVRLDPGDPAHRRLITSLDGHAARLAEAEAGRAGRGEGERQW